MIDSNSQILPVTVTLASTTGATRVNAIDDFLVDGGRRVYILAWKAALAGGTVWSGGAATEIYVESTSGLGGDRFITIPVASLTTAGVMNDNTAGIVLEDLYYENIGGIASLGLAVVADGNAAAGSDLVFTMLCQIAVPYA